MNGWMAMNEGDSWQSGGKRNFQKWVFKKPRCAKWDVPNQQDMPSILD
jgi:hypothetical protein